MAEPKYQINIRSISKEWFEKLAKAVMEVGSYFEVLKVGIMHILEDKKK